MKELTGYEAVLNSADEYANRATTDLSELLKNLIEKPLIGIERDAVQSEIADAFVNGIVLGHRLAQKANKLSAMSRTEGVTIQ